ncbi:hypothetical protein HOB94_07820 [bacterium]|nr:hypothetical protein [bacterium]MBT4633777.1 hypothetical protein [bacterium]
MFHYFKLFKKLFAHFSSNHFCAFSVFKNSSILLIYLLYSFSFILLIKSNNFL